MHGKKSVRSVTQREDKNHNSHKSFVINPVAEPLKDTRR